MAFATPVPDDSREADERAEARRLREVRARVKTARAVVSAAPGLDEVLTRDWQRAGRFYARFGITEAMLRNGVPIAGFEALSGVDRVKFSTNHSIVGRKAAG